MESIKHKMDTMVKEKDAAIEKAMGFEAETEELNKVCSRPYRHKHYQLYLVGNNELIKFSRVRIRIWAI